MCARVFAVASEMVEHTAWSAQTSATQQQQQQHHQQSFNGTQRGWYRHHRRRDGADDFLDDHNSDVSVNGGAHHNHHHHRFSLFRWFKRRDSDRGSRRQHAIFRRAKRRASTSSTSSSVDTFYSTATVRSFAFHSGARREARAGGDVALTSLEPSSGAVGPFAPGAAKLVERRRIDATTSAAGTTAAAATCTLPSGFSQRQGIEARYSLHPVGNPFISYDNIPIVRPRTFAEVRRRNNENNGAVGTVTSDSSLSSAKKVHVKGKRRAPEPPVTQRIVNVQVQLEGGAANGARPASRGRRKRRPAPKPPGYTETLSSNQDTLSSGTSITGMDACLAARDNQTISNDTLVLRRGVLLSKKDIRSSRSKSRTPTMSVCESDGGAGGGASTSTSNQTTASSSKAKPSAIMPRPWYKRNVFNDHSSGGSRDSTTTRGRSNGDVLRGVASPIPPETKDENVSSTSTSSTLSSSFPFESSLSRLNFFRGDRHHKDDKKKENKRKSGVSILTNISELDKEAAAIVQEEQARNRASMILQATRMDEEFDRRMAANEEIVQEIVNSSMENSPRRSARALISKFNAMGGNINKITVNSNFFTRNGGSGGASPKAKAKRYSGIMDDRAPRDLSKYFLPRQSSSPSSPRKESAAMFTEIVQMPKPAAKPTTPTTTTTTTKTAGEKVTKPEEGNNEEFAKSLAAELDDVATGIARLRRELDERPKLIADQEKKTSPEKTTTEQKKETPVLLVNNLSTSRDKELANFDKEFTRIFDEIDKQLRTRDSRLLTARARTSANETSLSNQVAKVLDILVNAEKDAAAAASAVKNPAQPAKESKSTDVSMDNAEAKKEPRPRPATVRISGVDDKTTTELKEMLKEMKHSLPKRPKPGSSQLDEKKSSAAAVASTSGVPPVAKVSSTKVSSGVQTSGNVRRIVNEPPPPRLAYQLIKPGEFEVAKSKAENTYANVMERSVNANARVAPRREGSEKRVKIDSREGEDGARGGKPEEAVGEEGGNLDDIRKQCMNTLAVNRLLRKLEAAIASGNHQQAAGLARELAQLKIHCSVVRQRAAAGEKLNLSMYIEDKQAHQGPIPLQLPTNMTVAQLKAKIQLEFEIPSNVQRWIIGKNLADNDESTLEDLQAVEGSPVFLYLVAPLGMHASKKSPGDHAHESLVDLQDKEAIKADKEAKAGKEEEEEAANPEERVINEKNDERVREDEARAEAAVKRDEAKEEVMPVKVEAKEEVEEANAEEPPPPPPATQAPEEKKGSLSKEEKLKRYEEELMTLENCDAISNAEPIECPVCFMITIPGEGVVLRDCLHSFCRICVANTVRYCEEAEVKCPYRDADYTCESTLQEREIKALVAPEVYQQHLAKSITQAENSAGNNAFHCKTPDCPGWCIYDDNVNNFLCPVCKVNNCLTCQAIHMGKNCRQYQEELKYSKDTDHESKRTAAMLEEMVDRGEALPCPTCAVVLMKKWGCDWLRCSMCKTEICWVTRGPRWGPGGKGDTSGGCRCGENGVKCHPRCNYCH